MSGWAVSLTACIELRILESPGTPGQPMSSEMRTYRLLWLAYYFRSGSTNFDYSRTVSLFSAYG